MKKQHFYTIGISGFYGDDNVGDDILQLAVLKGIEKNLKYKKIVIFTSNVEKNIGLFQREGLDYESFNILYSGRWGLKERNRKPLNSYSWIIKNIRELRKCDIHLIGPGNLIKDNTNKFLATFWVLRGLISHLLRKPFAFFAIGVADVNYFHSKFIIKKILNKALFITTRDNNSLEKLRRLNVTVPYMESFPDLSYTLIEEKNVKQLKKTPEIRQVGLNFANFSLKFFNDQVIKNYKRIVREFLIEITKEYDYTLLFFPFAGESHFNDSLMCEYLSAELDKFDKHIHKHTYENICELKNMISTCDAFVGTRFHANLFAVQESVPTVAISWDWKAKNFFAEAGLGEYTLEVEKLRLQALLGAWDKLKLNYLSYHEKLRRLNEEYYTLSSHHFGTLMNHL